MNFKTYLSTVRLYSGTFAAVTALVLGIGLAWILLAHKQYVSTTQLMVSMQGSTTAEAYQNDSVIEGRVYSYIALLTTDVISQPVIDSLGIPLTPSELSAKISASRVPPNTAIIDVALTDESPELAQRLAHAVAEQFVSYVNALETPAGEGAQKVQTNVVTEASTPQRRNMQQVVLGTLAGLLALLAGGAAVWIRSLIDPVVRTDYRAALGAALPVLGTVGEGTETDADLDGYRVLRLRLFPPTPSGGCRVVAFVPSDGYTEALQLAWGLGQALAGTGTRAMVLDADPAAPSFRLSNVSGKSGVSRDLASTGFPRGGSNHLDGLTIASWRGGADQLTGSTVAGVISSLRKAHEAVLIVVPPATHPLMGSELAIYADDVVILASLGRSTRRNLSGTAEALRTSGAKPLGVVLLGGSGDERAGVESPPSASDSSETYAQPVPSSDIVPVSNETGEGAQKGRRY